MTTMDGSLVKGGTEQTFGRVEVFQWDHDPSMISISLPGQGVLFNLAATKQKGGVRVRHYAPSFFETKHRVVKFGQEDKLREICKDTFPFWAVDDAFSAVSQFMSGDFILLPDNSEARTTGA